MVDYRENIESLSGINDKEREFLIAYFCKNNQQLKKCCRYDSAEYKYWHRWLKQHQYLLYKIVNFSKVDLIKNSKDAFDFVLNHCIDIIHSCTNKQNKTKLKALEVLQKICGLEQYATAQIQQLNNTAKQNELAKLTTEQLKQLACSVRENIDLLQQNTKLVEAETSDDIANIP